MLVGLKVHADYETRDAYRRLFDGKDVPSRLAELGIEAVEIPLYATTDQDAASSGAQRLIEAGLRVSFHPYTEGTSANPAEFAGLASVAAAQHERFFATAARAAEVQGETVVNIHPAAADSTRSRTELIDRSVSFFSWAKQWCSDRAPSVIPVAELQVAPLAGESITRVGDTPDELERVVTRSGVPACWDVGHAVWNHRRFGSRLAPTDELWGRIGHVHCHDVDEVDHRVLRRGRAPWRDFLEELSGRGFSGTVIMEVTAPTFLEAGGLSALETSIAVVREAVG